jgi:hypothetical protein
VDSHTLGDRKSTRSGERPTGGTASTRLGTPTLASGSPGRSVGHRMSTNRGRAARASDAGSAGERLNAERPKTRPRPAQAYRQPRPPMAARSSSPTATLLTASWRRPSSVRCTGSPAPRSGCGYSARSGTRPACPRTPACGPPSSRLSGSPSSSSFLRRAIRDTEPAQRARRSTGGPHLPGARHVATGSAAGGRAPSHDLSGGVPAVDATVRQRRQRPR